MTKDYSADHVGPASGAGSRSSRDQYDLERFNPDSALKQLGEYIEKLNSELRRVTREAREEAEQVKIEHRQIAERCDKTQFELHRVLSELSGLESKLEHVQGALDAERTRNANLEKQVRRLTKSGDEAQAQVTILEERLDQATKKAEMAEEEVEHLMMEKTRLENRAAERDEAMEAWKTKGTELEKQVRKLTNSLGEAQGKISLLAKKLEEATERHTNDMRRLSERIPHEASHEVSLFQKRIEASLMSEFRELERMESSPMSMELGANLRTLLRRIYSKMQHIGLDFSRGGKP